MSSPAGAIAAGLNTYVAAHFGEGLMQWLHASWGGVNIWINAPTGITVDCMYFGAAWMEEQIRRVMEMH